MLHYSLLDMRLHCRRRVATGRAVAGRIFIGRFRTLFRHGPHCEAKSPKGVVQRIHEARAEDQAATVEHVARNGRPPLTGVLHVAERTTVVAAKARSGEIGRGVLAGVGPEVPTKVSTEVGGIFGALYIEFGRIGGVLSRGSELRKGVVGRQVEADRAGIVNGFDHRKVVTGVRCFCSGIVSRP